METKQNKPASKQNKLTNKEKRALIVYQITIDNFEESRHDRCRLWIHRTIIQRTMPICQRTYFEYLGIARELRIKQNLPVLKETTQSLRYI